MIDVPDLGGGFLEMWRELLLLAKQAPAPWTLIGAHMVALHGWKAGRTQPRASRDADILVNARVAGPGHVRLDVLGPDGVGSHISLQTIRVGKSSGAIPVPDILGAILVKVRAIEVDDVPQAQRADVAFLLSLVEDPDPLAAALSKSERRWLKRRPELADPTSPCYQGIAHPADAATVFRRLARGSQAAGD